MQRCYCAISGLNAELADRAEQLRASRQRLVAAHDAERHRLERDLHDGAQQQVVALKVKLGLAKAVADREGAEGVATMVAGLSDDAQEVVDAMRTVARGIYPPLLHSEGLTVALGAIRRATPVPLELDAQGLSRHSRPVEEAVYFCVLEAVDVAVQAGARSIDASAQEIGQDIVVHISHDGTSDRMNLESISDRVDAAGGSLRVESKDETIRIQARVPTTTEEAP